MAHVRENRKDSLDPLRTASKVRIRTSANTRSRLCTHSRHGRACVRSRAGGEEDGERERERLGITRSGGALAPSHTRALDARPAKRAARLLFKAFPFIVSTMCSVTRGRNSQPPRCGGPLRRVKRSFISLFSLSPFLFYFIIIPFGCCTSRYRSSGRCPPSFQTMILLIHSNSSHCSYIYILKNNSISNSNLRVVAIRSIRIIRILEPKFANFLLLLHQVRSFSRDRTIFPVCSVIDRREDRAEPGTSTRRA